MKNQGLIIGVVLLIIAGVIGVVVASGGDDKKPEMETHSNTTPNNQKTEDEEDTSSNVEATTSVEIKDFLFTPAMIKVKVGDTVTWTNQDSTQHNVVADEESADAPDGPLLSQGETYKFTFNKAGTYAYHCGPHPQMQGTVIVE